MNRNNIWIHIGLATVLIIFAAILGQIERWKTALTAADTVSRKTVERKHDLPTTLNSVPEVIVRFKPGITVEQIRAIASANHDTLSDEIESVNGLAVIDDLDNADAQKVAAQYAAMNGVIYAEPNFEVKIDDPVQTVEPHEAPYFKPTANQPNDPLFNEQWALNNLGSDGGTRRADLDALRAWETTRGSDEVVVAVIDSGVDYDHVDLKNNKWTRPANIPAYTDDELGTFDDINGYDATRSSGDPRDDNGHGTHCSGIIGAEGNNGEGIAGINWKVKIMPVKILNSIGIGTADEAIEAINYVIDRKKKGVNIRVINASFGSSETSQALEDAIRAAGDAGILLVAAAGNDGTDNDRRPHYPSNFDLPNVISVAALDRTDHLASFSNYGVKTVHVAAPGKAIVSTWLGGDYREASGTSMAAPYVAGVAALIIANEPRISMKNLRDRIIRTVDKLDALDGKVSSGGRICAANALGNIVKSHVHN